MILKTRSAVVKLGASKAWSSSARLMMARIGQKISLLVVVKKNMVLTSVS